MTRSHLRACPSCARHVRVSEKTCPFCGGPLAEAFRAAPAPRAPGARLTRAALFAFGTGVLAVAPGCSSSSATGGGDAGTDAGQGEPAYGGPPFLDASYGGPPPDVYVPPVELDAGGDAVADAGAGDAETDAPLLFDAAYGGPPLDSGGD
jgi:hypothetical protein